MGTAAPGPGPGDRLAGQGAPGDDLLLQGAKHPPHPPAKWGQSPASIQVPFSLRFLPLMIRIFFFLQIYKRVQRKKNVPSKYLLFPV